jgi:hypothetical protein
LDCYETRLEEIVRSCTSSNRKYWKTQRTIFSRKRRTELFQGSIFKRRKKDGVYNNFGPKHRSFADKALYELREKLIRNLGYRFESREWEETLLNVMVSNSDLFGTAMMRYHEKQLYKKFLDEVEIPPLGPLDFEL